MGLIVPTSKTFDKDLGWDRIVEGTHQLDGTIIKAGVMGDIYTDPPQSHPSGQPMPIATVGAYHEFGLGQDDRHWMREAFDANAGEYVARILSIYRVWQKNGGDLIGRLSALGKKMEKDQRDRIDFEDLIDTGQLRKSLDFDVEVEGGLIRKALIGF